MKKFITSHISEIMQVGGSVLVVLATALLNWIIALYVAGGMLIVWGVIVELIGIRKV